MKPGRSLRAHLPTTSKLGSHQVDWIVGIVGVKENKMDLEVIAQLIILTLMVVVEPPYFYRRSTTFTSMIPFCYKTCDIIAYETRAKEDKCTKLSMPNNVMDIKKSTNMLTREKVLVLDNCVWCT